MFHQYLVLFSNAVYTSGQVSNVICTYYCIWSDVLTIVYQSSKMHIASDVSLISDIT